MFWFRNWKIVGTITALLQKLWRRPAAPAPTTQIAKPQKDAMRAKYERARKRYDKFVEPKGPEPVKVERSPPKPRAPKLPVIEATPTAVVDHSDNFPLILQDTKRGEKVLIEESEIYGEFNFRDTILDQLDRYFIYLKRMRQRDPDAFAFYKKIGITLIPYGGSWIELQFMGRDTVEDKSCPRPPAELPPFFNKHRPSFGCYAYGANPHVEQMELDESHGKKWMWVPKFLYFTKYKNPPPTVQPMAGGDVYRMVIWWDRPQDRKVKRKSGVTQEYFVFISADGKDIRALKCLTQGSTLVKAKRRQANERGGPHFFNVPSRCWKIPDEYVSWAKAEGEPVGEFLARLFAYTVKHHEFSNYSMVRVAVRKKEMTAVFGVNVKKLGYFFQDRDIELTVDGQRKRIFHLVRAHERHTKNGTKVVPFHFRGLREFSWADYRVKITVPGRDHFMLPEIDIGSIDEYWQEKGEDYLRGEEYADFLVEAMEDGLGGVHR